MCILSPFVAKNPHHDKVTVLVVIVVSLLLNPFLLKSDFFIEIQCGGILPYHTNCNSVHFIVFDRPPITSLQSVGTPLQILSTILCLPQKPLTKIYQLH